MHCAGEGPHVPRGALQRHPGVPGRRRERPPWRPSARPHHQGRAWPAVRRALHIRSNKVDDPEDPSSPSSPARKQALQQTWMEMLSATSAAFQKGEDCSETPSDVPAPRRLAPLMVCSIKHQLPCASTLHLLMT